MEYEAEKSFPHHQSISAALRRDRAAVHRGLHRAVFHCAVCQLPDHGSEQTQLIESTYTVIGLECGGLLLKRIVEKAFGRRNTEED